MTTSAARDALRAHFGSTKCVPLLSLQHGYEYVTCFEAVWRAFAGDQTCTLMPVMTAAGYVSATLRSQRANGTFFSPPPEQGQPPKKKAKVQPTRQQPPKGRHTPAQVAMSPPPAAFPPPPTLPPEGSPQASPWPPAQQPAPHPTMLPTAPAVWPPPGAATHAPGAPGAERGGIDSPSTPQGVRSLGLLRALVMALPPHPTPPQMRALASVLSNVFRDALPPPPPAPVSPRQHGLGPEGLDPVCLRCAAWYQRPAAGGPAGCPACGSREAPYLPAAGD